MPLYDYQCPRCGREVTDVLVRSFKDDVPNCATCLVKYLETVPMVLKLSAPAIKYTYPAGHARAGRGGQSKGSANESA